MCILSIGKAVSQSSFRDVPEVICMAKPNDQIILESSRTHSIKGEFSSHDEAYFFVEVGDDDTKKENIWDTIEQKDARRLASLNDDELEKELQSWHRFPKMYYSFSKNIFKAIRELALKPD